MKHFFHFIIALSLSLSGYAQKPEVVVTTGHKGLINTMAISPDGTLMASGDSDKLIKVWDVATGRELRTLSGNSGRVNMCHFDATGKYVVAMLNDGEVKTWEARSGKEVSSFPADGSNEEVWIGGNGDHAVFVGDDSKIHIGNFKTGGDTRIIETDYAARIVVSKDGQTIVSINHQGKVRLYDFATGAEKKSFQLPNQFKHKTMEGAWKYPITPLEIDPSGQYLVICFDQDDYKARVFNLSDFSEYTAYGGHTNRITDVSFDYSGDHLLTTDHEGHLFAWDMKKKKLKWSEEGVTFNYNCIVAHPSQKALIVAEHNRIIFKRLRNGNNFRTIDPIGNGIVNMAYDQKGRFVAIASDDITIKLWDLQQNRISFVLTQAFFPVAFHPSGTSIASMGMGAGGMQISLHDVFTGEKFAGLLTDNELIQNLTFSKDGKYLAGSGFMGILKIWDLETNKMIHKLSGHTGGIYNLSFSPDGLTIASSGMDGTIRVWDTQSGKELRQTKAHDVIASDVKYSPDGKYLASSGWDKKVKLWNADDLTMVREYEGHKNMVLSVAFNQDGTMLASAAGNNAVAEADNSVMIWNVESGAITCHLTSHIDVVQKVVFEMGANYAYSSGNDGMVKMWNADKCEEVVSMVTVNSDDYVLLTPDNYYTASRDALSGVSFRVDGQLFPFDQFDLRLNRPDIVAQRIGKSPPGLIEAYRLAYLKRLKKMKFTEEMLGEDFHLPDAEITTKGLAVATKESSITLSATFKDEKYNLDRVYVYVNDVPIDGIEGIDLRGEATKEKTMEIKVGLIPGINKIQVSCLNERGAESLRQTHEVIRETEEKVGDLHIIAIGVSDYKEDRFKLDFAAKDARDFIAMMKQTSHMYKEVHVKEITDSLATVENITALEEYLKNTNVEDVVIMFFAGHGMLNKQKEYFFGTYDIEFKNPLGRGLSYTKIEALFNRTKALKKLLIMDTCHSGEVEEEDVKVDPDGDNDKRNVTTKEFAERGGAAGAPGVGLYNSFELMQSLFSDIRRGTGATVISSAGGAEYAYESADWSNGLFTYCMLDGLKSRKADLDGDGKIQVSELRYYVGKEVSGLSDGKQHPTFRNENLAMDWVIW